MKDLIDIHLHTHSSTSNHLKRNKYRSAVYVFSDAKKLACEKILQELQKENCKKIITKILLFKDFKLNREDQLNYLYSRTNNQFCKRYIHPKLTLLLKKYSKNVNFDKIEELKKLDIKL